jgi:hypothetical protein
MKLWALLLIVLVGCTPPYQPSPAERFNQESEALNRLTERVIQLSELKSGAESPDPHPAVLKKWNDHRDEYERLQKVKEMQEKKVRELGMALGQ